jgi:hypothetical protein
MTKAMRRRFILSAAARAAFLHHAFSELFLPLIFAGLALLVTIARIAWLVFFAL